MIVRLVTLAVVAALALGETAMAAPPRHIMSLNICTDELLLDLVPAERIASVTFLSRSPSNSYLWPAAARVAINRGSAEEALTEKPDLVLAGTYGAPQARLLLKKLGIRLVEVPPANSFAEIRDVTRMVAKAVGEPGRGEAMIAHMDAILRALAATRPARTVRVVAWSGGGGVPGRGTLFDAILSVAGGVNIASTTEGAEEGRFGLEQLLFAQPDVLAYGSEGYTAPSLRADADQHPLLLKAFGHRRIVYPEALYGCGVPESVDAATALRTSLLSAMKFPKSVIE